VTYCEISPPNPDPIMEPLLMLAMDMFLFCAPNERLYQKDNTSLLKMYTCRGREKQYSRQVKEREILRTETKKKKKKKEKKKKKKKKKKEKIKKKKKKKKKKKGL